MIQTFIDLQQSYLFKLCTDLLQQYREETAEVERLKREVAELEGRLRYLTESFDRASVRLQNCYKTP